MKIKGLVIALAVVGGLAAGAAVALKTPKGKEVAEKAKAKVKTVTDKFKSKKAGAEDVVEATCECPCDEAVVEEAVVEEAEDLPEIAPED